MAQAVRVLRPGGALLVYGSPERLWICHLKIIAAEELGLDFKQHISWVYKQGGDSRMRGTRCAWSTWSGSSSLGRRMCST